MSDIYRSGSPSFAWMRRARRSSSSSRVSERPQGRSEGEPRPATANGGNAAHKTESGQRGTAGRDVGTLAPSPDAATEPRTEAARQLLDLLGSRFSEAGGER